MEQTVAAKSPRLLLSTVFGIEKKTFSRTGSQVFGFSEQVADRHAEIAALSYSTAATRIWLPQLTNVFYSHVEHHAH